MPDGGGLQREFGRLCDFLRGRRDAIITSWTQRVRSLSPAHELSESALADHLPAILSLIADYVESVRTGRSVSFEKLAKAHAVDRLGRGFDFDLIVREYGFLRGAILDLWESEVGPSIDVAELRQLDAAFDEAVTQAALRYAQSREKLLKALDRVSEAALTSANLDAFLEGLLRASLAGMESVDTCVVLLREGDTLRVRAAVGIEEELNREYSVRVGEGIAGHIAAEGRPVFVRDASVDPLIVSPAIRGRGVHALYGVPMVREGRVIGVAHMGSLSAFEFSDEDKLLFRTMVSRATSGVIKAQVLADLERAVAGRDHVLAVVSHDLRNQVGTIDMGASLLARKTEAAETSGDLAKPIEAIRRTTGAMKGLLGDLLDMASIEAGKLSFEPDIVSVGPMLEQACLPHKAQADAHGLRLKVERPSESVAVRADPKRIQQVLGNLLGNAIKFSNPKGTVVLAADAGDTEVTVSVSDTGPGNPPEDLQSIFEPFKTGRRDTQSGTGLGLYIARGIIQHHGGRIWVTSEPGKGSRFFFSLPRVK